MLSLQLTLGCRYSTHYLSTPDTSVPFARYHVQLMSLIFSAPSTQSGIPLSSAHGAHNIQSSSLSEILVQEEYEERSENWYGLTLTLGSLAERKQYSDNLPGSLLLESPMQYFDTFQDLLHVLNLQDVPPPLILLFFVFVACK